MFLLGFWRHRLFYYWALLQWAPHSLSSVLQYQLMSIERQTGFRSWLAGWGGGYWVNWGARDDATSSPTCSDWREDPLIVFILFVYKFWIVGACWTLESNDVHLSLCCVIFFLSSSNQYFCFKLHKKWFCICLRDSLGRSNIQGTHVKLNGSIKTVNWH